MGQCSWHVLDQVDSKIHLEPGETLIHARLQALAIYFRIFRFRRVAVDPNLVPVFTPEHLVHRHIKRLTGKIPERHLNAAHAACLARLSPKLANLSKYFFNVTRVLAEYPAFQHQGVRRTGPVANFSKSIDALVGVDTHQRAGHRGLCKRRYTEIRDLQLRWPGVGTRVMRECFQHLVRPEGRGGQRARTLQKTAAS